MFKISKGWAKDSYKIESFLFVKEANFYTKLYTIDNKTGAEVVQLLQGRILNSDCVELQWALHIARLRNTYALVGEDGVVKSVPTRQRRKHGIKGPVVQTQSYTTKIASNGTRVGNS